MWRFQPKVTLPTSSRLSSTRHISCFFKTTSVVSTRATLTTATAQPCSSFFVERTMRFCRPAPFFFLTTTTAVVLSFRPNSSTAADNQTFPRPGGLREPNCPPYGYPLSPHDVHYNNETVKKAFERIRSFKRSEADPVALQELQKSISPDASAVTLTLIGYKGGPLQEQINQDRAVIVTPFYITTSTEDAEQSENEKKDYVNTNRILLGVFDGHAPLGERVSEFTATELPGLLAAKLRTALDTNVCKDEKDEIHHTVRVLTETFIELDRRVPADPSGGCTATVVLKQGSKVYIANTGDSRSFIVSYRSSTKESKIIYISREDKPNLPDEKSRIEAAGGQVYIPMKGTSRVVYNDPVSGAPTGLAMSRSIGDWAAGKKGVIPDPIVHVIDLDSLVSNVLHSESSNEANFASTPYTVTMQGESVRDIHDDIVDNKATRNDDDDVYIFAVSATDGMMDFLNEEDIARILAEALFDESGAHPISACEHLIFAAAQAWQQAKHGRYRDDIALAVSTLRRPLSTRDQVQKPVPLAQ